MRNRLKLIIFFSLIFTFVFSFYGFSQDLPRVAVMDITSTASGYIWGSGSSLAGAATDIMINSLLATHQFRVFERSKLEAIKKEQEFQYSGLVDPATAVKLGKMIGVDTIITGATTSIGFSKSGGISVGGVSISGSSVKVVMSIRMIDVTTGEIIYSTIKSAKASKSSISANIIVPVAGNIGLSQKQAASLMSAVKKICDKVALELAQVAKTKNLKAKSSPIEGYVVKVVATSSGGIIKVYTNLGKNKGAKVGQEIKIYHKGETIVDPKTNEVLDQELDLIARAKIIKVKDKLSIALVTNKLPGPDIQPMDVVEIVRP